MGKLLTVDDVRKRYECGRDTAYKTIKDAGGKVIAGKWRVREERLDEYELNAKSRRSRSVVAEDLAAELLRD